MREKKPERNSYGMSKLTWRQVVEIRRMYDTGRGTCAEIGKRFGVTTSTVSAIGGRVTWKKRPRYEGRTDWNPGRKRGTKRRGFVRGPSARESRRAYVRSSKGRPTKLVKALAALYEAMREMSDE